MGLGTKGWLAFIGGVIGLGIAGLLLMVFISGAWYRWGILGTFLIIAAILLAIAWFVDRRAKKSYEALDDAM